MISLLLDDVSIGFDEATAEGGATIKIMVVQDLKSGIFVRIPFVPEAARAVAAHLDGRPVIQVAHTLPPQ